MDATRTSGSGSTVRRAGRRLLARLRLHRHRVEPDLSALVSFPSCRCGAHLWPDAGGLPAATRDVESEPPLGGC